MTLEKCSQEGPERSRELCGFFSHQLDRVSILRETHVELSGEERMEVNQVGRRIYLSF